MSACERRKPPNTTTYGLMTSASPIPNPSNALRSSGRSSLRICGSTASRLGGQQQRPMDDLRASRPASGRGERFYDQRDDLFKPSRRIDAHGVIQPPPRKRAMRAAALPLRGSNNAVGGSPLLTNSCSRKLSPRTSEWVQVPLASVVYQAKTLRSAACARS